MRREEYDSIVTPCFVFEEREFKKSVNGFRASLEEKFDRIEIGYSVKTNSLPFAMKKAHELGCKAEVVSFDEYNLARTCGFLPSEIIYNGSLKSKETFLEAVVEGGIVNIETKRELEWLDFLPDDGNFKVGIRLNINISKVSPDDADGDDDNSRFGFSDYTSEFKDAVDLIKKLPNVTLAGLHIHRTAHSRSPRFYERSTAYAVEVIRKYNLKLDYLDIGGGYFGIFPNKPTFNDYAVAISNGLDGLKIPTIIIEPGNAFVASCFSFVSEIIDTKWIDNSIFFATTDGSRNDIDPFFHKADYLKEIIYKGINKEGRPKVSTQIIAGCTCLEYDRLFTLTDMPKLEVGDRIIYNNVGAYTMTLSPLFIRFFPRVYAMTEKCEIFLVREAWSAEDYMRKDKVIK